ncbi:MAG TPA: S8 family serine peptidase [Pilimelia sp.]|nr:S8 family serine peptidase [Pilimelia sp.]
MNPLSTARWRSRSAWGGAALVAMLGVTMAVTPAHAAEGAVLGAGDAKAIPGSYIVVLKNDTLSAQSVRASATALASRHGGTVAATYTAALRGFSAKLSAQAARRLAADRLVAYVQQDMVMSLVDTQPNPPSWGLDRIDQRNLPLNNSYTYPNRERNVHAYVIDTGVRITHQDFGGRASHGRDTVSEDNDSSDCHGHGTHVAGTVGGTRFGVAKNVFIHGVRVLNCQGSGTTTDIVQGIDWVSANGIRPAVANMSLGGGVNTALDNAVANSISQGITYAIAAGNSGANACNFSPARTPAAITLGATAINDTRASFSNFGTCVDLFAPGVSITSAWFSSDTATNTISGTSMASPHACGVAALILSANPNLTPQQVRDRMVADATPNVVGNPGTGSPNRLLFVNNGGTQPPPSRFEAENALISQGQVDSNHAGFSGTGFANYDNVAGSYVEWTVNVPTAGDRTVTIRFANGTTANRPMDITVNGALDEDNLAFPGTGGWPNWSNATATLTLRAGENKIRATAVVSAGGPNVDYLQLG